MLRIAIVPAGAWGTALAVPAAQMGNDVRLWRRHPGWTQNWDHGHAALKGLSLPTNVQGLEEVGEALAGADLVIIGSASVALREHCRLIRPHLRSDTVLLSITKGLEEGSHLRMSEVIAQELPEHRSRIAALSGPNFAYEVAKELPSGSVVATIDAEVGAFVQGAIMTPRFRVYTNTDMVGVELGGALKNVVALGVGISDGLGMGDNARAALITRGLAEIARLGAALGADVITFAGLAGMGDLVLTCTGDRSRNRQAGLAIGQGQSAAGFLSETQLTVEGIPTTRAAWQLAAAAGVKMPITEQIYAVLYQGVPPLEGLKALMGRQRTAE
jgi:glycerol-3-phosphate dehydrogenase (NAD(P)+)